ncbi:hypothetical protein [Rhizobium ruizarguesonis]|jgi:cytochrome c biogenesis factor|uniref:Uncharacterized protein n=1 Tax=Rhizobium ruizarguesonis TaxID=2081791 RepID=A0AB38IA49_9HYPH|nr:hypothetical protein [Rhizobium ruizarguesonis]NEI09900.1 hypothetical protein [Rhizobium ruizarguesonis]NEI31783.1 hypothetical protein [Rhizobium ruizarguesonis]TAY96409.1 hypothetical protein ELH85_25950 [Rhizobium ruizarguesonis]TAZ80792.1 hypothetical protein ELH68_24725 [Rhizobium ruizarguesonis]TBA07178.1 hypothetical protein ELH64_23250 [Rhizobium ruizarguesonis]
MIIEIGHYALVPALVTSIIHSIVPVTGVRRRDQAMMDVASKPTGSKLTADEQAKLSELLHRDRTI